MDVELIITAEADEDFGQAYTWYENQHDGLGEDFARRVEACIERICRMPTAYEKIHENYRRAIVRRFPYAVIYDYEDDVVTVYCIFHTSQDPAKWRRRLP
jgi:plasmid stabilization system protein ParE